MTCVFSVISDQLTEPALESLLVVIRGEDGDGEGDDDDEEEVDDDDEEEEDEEGNGEKEDNSEMEEDEDDDDSEPEEEEKVGSTSVVYSDTDPDPQGSASFGNLDPHQDSHPHQIKIRIYKLNLEQDPPQFADVNPACMEYEPI